MLALKWTCQLGFRAPLPLRGRRGTRCTPQDGSPINAGRLAVDFDYVPAMLTATGHAERVHKMCGCARKSAEHYLGQRKYGEHTIVLIVCREKTVRAWWNSMKAKQLTHKQLTLRTYIHRYLNTYTHTYLPTYIHTTIVPPSLSYFLFPSRFLCSV